MCIRDRIVVTLNDIEKSKHDIEKSTELNRTQLVTIINDLIKVSNSIEKDIAARQEEIMKTAEVLPQPESEVYDLMDSCRSNLELVKKFLSKVFAEGPGADTLKAMCADGKPGKVKLACSHYLCSHCFFTLRDLCCDGDNEALPCTACGGIRSDISIGALYW
eukprot:TRINITY_DN4352_c0_g1_i1.p1 TRINITY_DN4352_c0_g1~~TRINITY_DN4352_c0_g1_i1.p1  ORF type:complete len:162 (-),score=35.47 TRINITY_DN4352_c0_g1_i1:237-722(-)